MNKKEQLWSLMIPVEKRLPKVYPEGDHRNLIMVWVPPNEKRIPNGRFYLAQAGLFVMQRQQLLEAPELADKMDQHGDLFHTGYYATDWMRLYYD